MPSRKLLPHLEKVLISGKSCSPVGIFFNGFLLNMAWEIGQPYKTGVR
jgi:hypothetical protein